MIGKNLRPVAPWTRICKKLHAALIELLRVKNGTIFRILFLAFSAAREKEKRELHSSSSPSYQTQAAGIVFPKSSRENNDCCRLLPTFGRWGE
jgi:hypothetical protein